MCRTSGRRCSGSHSGKRSALQKTEANARARAAYARTKSGTVRTYIRRTPRRIAPAGVVLTGMFVAVLPRDPAMARAHAEAVAKGARIQTKLQTVRITPGFVTADGTITDQAREELSTKPARLALLEDLVARTWTPNKEEETDDR